MTRATRRIGVALAVLLLAPATAGPVSAATAKKTTTVKPVVASKRERVPALSASAAVAFCKTANSTKATLTDIKSKKQQLGSKTPSTVYRQEIEVDQELAKVSPKQLAPDFKVLTSYLELFAKLADAKDVKTISAISAQMGSDQLLTDYLDATIRIEGFVRRTCGYPVGI